MNLQQALEEYEKLIKSTADFEASIIEIQEMIRKNKDSLANRKFIISKAIDKAKKLNIELTIFLIASEIALGMGE